MAAMLGCFTRATRQEARVRHTSKYIVGYLSAALYLLGFPHAVFANPYESGGKVDQYFGAYTETIPIVVPPFHGIEPKLSLSYHSSGGSGLGGVGWSLRGLSVIESIPGAGYQLDGQDLIACTQQTNVTSGTPNSSSCSTGGNYSTLSERYQKILISGSTATVWEKNGTKAVYTSSNALRKFVVSSVTDTTNNNIVTYNWNKRNAGFTSTHPDSITYNGTTIKFHYAARVSNETFGEGGTGAAGTLDTINKQLVTIDVCVREPGDPPFCILEANLNRARAYSLTYKASAGTSRPLLTSVQMYGKDAVLSEATGEVGKVLSGTAFPPSTFVWNDVAPTYSLTRITDSGGASIADWGTNGYRAMVDFNGDGKTDFCRDVMSGGPVDPTGLAENLKCAMSTGWGMSDEWNGYIWHWGEGGTGTWVDWDGDGKTDYCRILNNAIWCAISTGTGINDQQVGVTLGVNNVGSAGTRWFIDWNGDGKADYCRVTGGTFDAFSADFECAFSKGSPAAGYDNYIVGGISTPAGVNDDVRGNPATRALIDWNGDGKPEFCRVLREADAYNQLQYYWLRCLSSATGSDSNVGNFYTLGDATTQWWADVNADGKTDHCVGAGGGQVKCMISTGTGYIYDGASWAVWSNPYQWESIRWGDMNGDGKADSCRHIKHGISGPHNLECTISGSGGLSGIAATIGLPDSSTGTFYEKHWLVDWNGDGRAEYCANAGSNGGAGSILSCLRRDGDGMGDLVTSFSNGIGATTVVAYVPASQWSVFIQPPNNNPPSFPTVSQVTTPDGTTTYAYSGGQYDAAARRFLGFAWVKVTAPCVSLACPYTETLYRLDTRWPTQPAGVFHYGTGTPPVLLDKTLYTYSDTTLSPYRFGLISESVWVYDGFGGFNQSLTTREYDKYGNVTKFLDSGLFARNGSAPSALLDDDRSIETVYLYNTTKYIVDKPGVLTGRNSITATAEANKMTQVSYGYDGDTTGGVVPTVGKATRIWNWLNSPDSVLISNVAYDTWGNVITETDAQDYSTNYTIDPKYHQYITEVKNPLLQTTSTALSEWDVQCGQRRKETQDQNGASTIHSYDNLCRRIRTDFPGDGWQTISYDPTLRITEVTGPSPNGNLWEKTYFDGLGRTKKITRRGPGGDDIIAAEHVYNARGKLKESLKPRYSSDLTTVWYSPHYYPFDPVSPRTFYDYDNRDRPIKVTLPDLNTQTTTYGLRIANVTDELGHTQVTQFNIRGQKLYTASASGAFILSDITNYSYDGRSNPLQISQLGQNGSQWSFTTFTYDSLGRKTALSDPDAGTRSYAYDNVGNLIDEWDGNGLRTHYAYDALKRRTSKTINYSSFPFGGCVSSPGGRPRRSDCDFPPTPVTVTWTYDQVRSGYYNVGQLTSMTDPSGTATYNYDLAGNLVNGGRTVDGQLSNGAGGYFTYGGSDDYGMGRAACESKYGVGQCSTGSCGYFDYWYQTGAPMCDCAKPAGSYEWIYSNGTPGWTGDNHVGQSYGGQATSVAGINRFVRQKTSNTCDANSWRLSLANYGGAGIGYVFNKQYDVSGRLLATTYPDGSTVGTTSTPLGYDEAGRLSSIPGFVNSAGYNAEGKLNGYEASNGTTTTFDYGATTGRLDAYSTVRDYYTTSLDGTMVLGPYARALTNSATTNFETFAIEPRNFTLVAGQTITVSSCSSAVQGASGFGDTYLRLLNPSGTEVASNNDAGGACGVLSTLSYTVPAGGIYTVRAGCFAMSSCSGTVAAQIKNPLTNLALNKTATQSNTGPWVCNGLPEASKAVDGNRDGNFWGCSVTHTDWAVQPRWSVDIGTALIDNGYMVDYVDIYNRTDSARERLEDFQVEVFNPDANTWVIINVPGICDCPTRVNIGFKARYVAVKILNVQANYLHMAEVEVYGRVPIPLTSRPKLLHMAAITRDPEGRISQITSTRPYENWAYGYSPNPFHQLTSATNLYDSSYNQTFSYDPNGNMTFGPAGTATYPTGPNPARPHALLTGTQGGTQYTYSYDNNGQMIGASPGGYVFTWDGGGRLTNIGGVQHTYDADGYRLKKTYGGTTTTYLGDDYEITNGAHTKYISLGGRVVAKQTGSGRKTWLHTDHQGSVIFGLDDQVEQVLSASYRPYGEEIAPSAMDSRGYTGQRKDDAGMLYLHARFYHPGLGRFMLPDPSTPTQRPIGLNRYAYAQNDPINRTDIDGLGAWENFGGEFIHRTSEWARVVKDAPTLALFPSTLNAAARGDVDAFAKSLASEVIISSAIAASIVTAGMTTPATAALMVEIGVLSSTVGSFANSFALTMINGGTVDQALINGGTSLGMGMLSFGAVTAVSQAFTALSGISGFTATGIEQTNFGAPTLFGRISSLVKDVTPPLKIAGTVIGGLTGDPHVAFNSRDQAIGLSPMSRLSSGSGSLYGYGYDQSLTNQSTQP